MTSDARNAAATTVARLKTDEQSARKIDTLFSECFADTDIAVSLVENCPGSWTVAVHFPVAADERAVRALAAAAAGPTVAKALAFERVAAKDWVGESLAGLQPVAAGRFIVHGAHDRARIAPNRIGIEIEASLAFGTGHHGTTRGCLLALDQICKRITIPYRIRAEGHSFSPLPLRERVAKSSQRVRPEVGGPMTSPARLSRVRGAGNAARSARAPLTRLAHATRSLGTLSRKGRGNAKPPPSRRLRILDLGTGSGILAIAAAHALRQRVLATDIDTEAVHVARANTRRNGIALLVEVVKADGVAQARVRIDAPFDLVFANILLAPLQHLAAPLIKLAAPGARVILSGLLNAQANAAIAAYRPLALERRIDIDGWTTLVLKRRRS